MKRGQSSQKLKKIKAQVASLFATRGYHRTSMREIAKEVGLTQSSLYHYFKSKEEILFCLMNEAMDEALKTLKETFQAGLSPEGRLRRILSFYTTYYAGDQDRLVLLVNEMNALSPENRSILIAKQKEYVALIRSTVQELQRAHKAKNLDATVATFAFFGMVHYTYKWYRKDGPVSLKELGDIFTEIFLNGITLQEGKRPV
ncbi:MAG: TetR family transcriptional regulator [Deltaproteobacteria bacterium]|nr:TetR family transcriptional regulator [Deltaproteobacteria bacterium]MBW1927719.1 TetR family transcriptional regulator [Deltaproteobacteria bacterium]MBW2025098.1 TetR family transcriptional regulator [Deltaproteobacteria bacterium]MBW2125848.1 TetR family transcriptional regulator [Deltaproteobacteria bacterium]RLB18094.1 MAG: TetR/AcrR family transcriptional regulator [Deltaproteobacteria bacterium]